MGEQLQLDKTTPSLLGVTGQGITVHNKDGDVPAILMKLRLGALGQEDQHCTLVLQETHIHLLIEFLKDQATRLQQMSRPASGVQH